MAVLNKIRQRSIFLIVIIALALFSFVLADVIRNGGLSQGSQNVIATINGEDIDRIEFARQVEAYQQNLGPGTTNAQAMDMVWEMKVRQILLEEQFEALGIRVEGAQLQEVLAEEMGNNPNFLNEAGVFDEDKLREYVALLKSTSPEAFQQWTDYEVSVSKNALQEMYFSLIRAGIGATLTEGEFAYKFANDKVDFKFVHLPYSSVPDSEVEVTKADIQEYIEEHPERYQVEASRDLQFVKFVEAASKEDEQEAKTTVTKLLESRDEYNPISKATETLPGFGATKDVEAFVNQHSDQRYDDRFLFKDQLPAQYADELFNLEIGEVFGPYKDAGAWKITRVVDVEQIPDSAKARHILVAFQGSPAGRGITRSKEEAEQLADSLSGVIKRNSEAFAELAAEFSSDASNKDNAGELGWFTPGTMVPAFNDFVFQEEEGEIGVVETQFGYHVIQIQEQTNAERAVKLATVARTVEPSEKTINRLFAEVTKFELAAGEGDYVTLAEKDGKEVQTVQDIQIMEENIPGLGAQRQIVKWAFEEESEVGDIKRFEVRDGYVVVRLTEANAEGTISVEAASSEILPILKKEKKADIIKERISAEDLETIASEQKVEINTANAVNRNSPVLPGVGSEPLIVGAAFALDKGETSEPLTGENGVFVVELIKKTEAPQLESYRSYAAREAAAKRTIVNQEVLAALKDAAEIEDNRARFY